MSIGYDGETSLGNDPTKTTGPHGPREWSLGKPVWLSECRSTVDAIQAAIDMATKVKRGTGKRKGFCAQCAQIGHANHAHTITSYVRVNKVGAVSLVARATD